MAVARPSIPVNVATGLPLRMTPGNISPSPKLDTTVTVGEIEAWRAWLLSAGVLGSVYMSHQWNPGIPMTGAVHEGRGVHAWNSMQGVMDYIASIPAARPMVIGRVHLWGEVIEHTHGYRAENASIAALDCIVGFPNVPPRLVQDELTRLRWLYTPPPK